MIRSLLTISLLAAALSPLAQAASPARAYVPNEGDGTISVVDLSQRPATRVC